jgi:hypothetical protein
LRRKILQDNGFEYKKGDSPGIVVLSTEYIERKKDDPDIDKLIAAATEILHLSHHGDQQFIKCLRGNGAAKLRLAIVKLNGVFREDIDDE